MRLPQSVPILTAFTARVAGREITHLLESPAALARALADTQTVVGHDGVLCLFDPLLLSTTCLGKQDVAGSVNGLRGDGLTAPDEILQTAPLATILESIQALRHNLPDTALILATFAGPGLLWSQLQDAFESCGMSSDAGSDYVLDVIRNVVRSSLEMKADGIALIEQTAPGLPSELWRCHKTVRKLADFYDAGFIVFNLPGAEGPQPGIPAHCVFALASPGNGIGPLFGTLESSAASNTPPVSTSGDVPDNTAIEELKSWSQDGRAV
jgi:hypothetical protein